MTGFCGAILNSYGRFAVPAFTPVFLNLSLIGAALVASHWFAEPVFALAWGVLLAGCVQLLFQLPSLYRLDLVPRPIWDTKDEGVRRIMTLMVPALFGVSVSQINLMLDTVLASFPAYGQRFLAVLFRPTRRTATGNFRHCHCHRHTPQPVRPPGRFPPIVFQCHIGLGVALGAVDRHSRCPRVNHTRRADIGDTVSAQGLHPG